MTQLQKGDLVMHKEAREIYKVLQIKEDAKYSYILGKCLTTKYGNDEHVVYLFESEKISKNEAAPYIL